MGEKVIRGFIMSALKMCHCQQCKYVLRTKHGSETIKAINRHFRRHNKQLIKLGKEPLKAISVPYLG